MNRFWLFSMVMVATVFAGLGSSNAAEMAPGPGSTASSHDPSARVSVMEAGLAG